MKALLVSFSDAVSFLTIVPLPCPLAAGDASSRVGRALGWFPAVGALVGLAAGAAVCLGRFWWTPEVAAFLGLATAAFLTGGLHLDGFADTVDGLASWKKKEEALSIMRDARIGALGALGLFLILGLQWTFLVAIPSEKLLLGLMAAFALSRWGMVLSCHLFPVAKGSSRLGGLATREKSRPALWGASFLAAGISFASSSWSQSLFLLALTAALIWFLGQFFVSRFGGVTGDTLGASGEVTTLFLLALLASI